MVVTTMNNPTVLRRTLNGLLALDYPADYEIIVVNDGSTDNTRELVDAEFGAEKRIKRIHFPNNQGVCKARNAGIAVAKYPIIINMDHDCIPEKNWLRDMVAGFDSPSVGVVSAYDYYGGTSTAFRKEHLDRVGGYDEAYRYYREDTDLSFKVMDMGYTFRLVSARYAHDHTMVKPKGLIAFAKHVWQRLNYHQNDVLLWKKHPTKICAEFLKIRFGFLVDPFADFGVATGLWQKGGKLELSSPRGITFFENKSPFHAALIVLGGIGYVLAVKSMRLWASLKHRKLLI
ncbi:MAG: glycosyltransferase family A protein [Candidatus Diapherotrites archaeon]|nr:glycosyltransferase family A protein [Candidatus Diapherotrites archaeon]